MSHHERKLDYLNKKKVVYRRDPIEDKPSNVFDWGNFYSEGTYECYTLFNSRAKINTYKGLKWHLYVLWYLNPQIDQDEFAGMSEFICNKENGFVTFNVSRSLLESMIYEVSCQDLETPPPNKLRKIIFKDNSGLDMRQKLTIVGQMIGKKKLSESEIYDAILMLHDNEIKITVLKLAETLDCSTRTVHRNMGVELKKEKELLNQQLTKEIATKNKL